MKWFRFYSEVLHDPKVQKLTPAQFKNWVNLLCLANDTEPRGSLPPIDDVAFALRVTEQAAESAVDQLCKAGLFDREAGRVVAHGWEKRQRESDNGARRVQRHREKRNDTETPDVTLHETLQAPLHNENDAVSETLLKRPRTEQIQNRADPEQIQSRADAAADASADDAGVRDLRSLLLSKLPAKYQADPLTFDEAEALARDYVGRTAEVEAAVAAVRRSGGLPWPGAVRKHLPPLPQGSPATLDPEWRDTAPPLYDPADDTPEKRAQRLAEAEARDRERYTPEQLAEFEREAAEIRARMAERKAASR